MSKIETMTAELCDQLMEEASSGELDHIKKTIMILIEFSSYEVARHGYNGAAAKLSKVAAEFDRSFSDSSE